MAIPVIPILKTLAPLVANAGSIVAGLRAGSSAKIEDRVEKLEHQTLRAGEVLTALAQQLEVVAEQTVVLERRARAMLVVSVLTFAASAVALVFALQHG